MSEMVERVKAAWRRFVDGSSHGRGYSYWAIYDTVSGEEAGRYPTPAAMSAALSDMRARAAIEAMREPTLIEAACRAAADKRTGYICWEGISVHRAADVVDAVLAAALAEEHKQK